MIRTKTISTYALLLLFLFPLFFMAIAVKRSGSEEYSRAAAVYGSNDKGALVVAVVGESVNAAADASASAPEGTMRDEINEDQSVDMAMGVMEAYQGRSGEVPIRIEFFDDGGEADRAREIARSFFRRPDIVAVIGHGSSGTTIEAEKFYRKSGVPLLAPIATSPRIRPPEGGDPICFRVPLDDRSGQAPAIAKFVEENEWSRVFLIGDESRESEVYSFELTELLAKRLRVPDERRVVVSRDGGNIEGAVKRALDNSSDAIIFCGYGGTAPLVLAELRRMIKERRVESLPPVVLSDGCKRREFPAAYDGVEVFLSFPVLRKGGGVEASPMASYKDFGRAAGDLVFGAIREVIVEKGEVSRQSLRDYILNREHVVSLGTKVSFDSMGNNRFGASCVYRVDVSSARVSYEVRSVYDAQELVSE